MVAARTSALALVLLSACGDPASPSGADADIAMADGAPLDVSPADAAVQDGFGLISGDCDVLDDELSSAMPGLFHLAIDFDSLYTDADLDQLSAGAQKLVTDANAGGSSRLSEAFAFDVLARCEAAILLKSENEIIYDIDGKKTDFLAEMDSLKIGVSVTRAMSFPFEAPYPSTQAEALLTGKLGDILLSSDAVSAEDRWTKQILAILSYGPEHSAAVDAAYATLDASLQADTLVVVIQSDGADEFIYCNGPCN